MPTKNRRIQCGLVGLLLLLGCDKIKYQADAHDYYPTLGATSVQVQPDGRAVVTGTLESPGSGDLYYLGFCIDTAPAPQAHIGQQLVQELSGNTFSTAYGTLDGTRRYYVRSFAANEYGFAYGSEAVIDRPVPDTATQVPCHPADRTITVENGASAKTETLYADALDPIYHTCEVRGDSYNLSLEFGRTPTNGSYKIWDRAEIGSDLVTVLFNSASGGSYYLKNGGSLYVRQLDATHIRVWLCHQEVGNGLFVTAVFSTK